jgi:hypothetical protein
MTVTYIDCITNYCMYVSKFLPIYIRNQVTSSIHNFILFTNFGYSNHNDICMHSGVHSQNCSIKNCKPKVGNGLALHNVLMKEPWAVPLAKQLSTKFCACNGPRRCITMFTNSEPYPSIFIIFICFTANFPTMSSSKHNFQVFLPKLCMYLFPMRATCHARLPFCDLN